MPEITISYDAAHDEPYPYEAIAAISRVVGQHLPVSELTWTRRYDDTPELETARRIAAGAPAEPTEAQRLAEQIIKASFRDGVAYMGLAEFLPPGIDDDTQKRVGKLVDAAEVAVSWPEPATTPEQDGEQAEGDDDACPVGVPGCPTRADDWCTPACEDAQIARAIRGLGAPCTGCALAESSCRAHGGRCCDLCQHRGEQAEDGR